jgi:hypothetical protein
VVYEATVKERKRFGRVLCSAVASVSVKLVAAIGSELKGGVCVKSIEDVVQRVKASNAARLL